MKRAEEVDRHLAETGEPIGPLHGLPISLKDQFTMKGLETIMGQRFLRQNTSFLRYPYRLRILDRKDSRT